MLIPYKDEYLAVIYFCPRCRKYFSKDLSQVKCAIIHQPGTCCHHKDIEITEDDAHDINNLIIQKFERSENAQKETNRPTKKA